MMIIVYGTVFLANDQLLQNYTDCTSYRCSAESQLKIRFINLFTVNSSGMEILRFFLLNIVAMSKDEMCRSFFIFLKRFIGKNHVMKSKIFRKERKDPFRIASFFKVSSSETSPIVSQTYVALSF